MVRTIHKGLDYKKILTKIKQVIKEYLQKLAELEKQYLGLKRRNFIKKLRNKHQRENLTRQFKVQMMELGVAF